MRKEDKQYLAIKAKNTLAMSYNDIRQLPR